jgi:hypothetical protein
MTTIRRSRTTQPEPGGRNWTLIAGPTAHPSGADLPDYSNIHDPTIDTLDSAWINWIFIEYILFVRPVGKCVCTFLASAEYMMSFWLNVTAKNRGQDVHQKPCTRDDLNILQSVEERFPSMFRECTRRWWLRTAGIPERGGWCCIFHTFISASGKARETQLFLHREAQ